MIIKKSSHNIAVEDYVQIRKCCHYQSKYPRKDENTNIKAKDENPNIQAKDGNTNIKAKDQNKNIQAKE